MDMSAAEQMIWAAVFAHEEHDIRQKQPHGDVEGRMLSAAQYASYVVRHLRSASNFVQGKHSARQHMGQESFDHLRQMTFKAED